MERIFLQDPETVTGFSEGQIVVRKKGTIIGRYPIVPLKEILVIGNPQITTQAIKACLEWGVEIQYYSVWGKYAGMLSPAFPGNIRRRMAQYALVSDEHRSLEWSKSTVSSKFKSYEVEYRRITDNGWHGKVRRFLPEIAQRRVKLNCVHSRNELLGIEGMTARIWFRFLGESLPENWSWNGRNSHPPRDEFNALLSFLYAMTAGELDRMVRRRGLDPALSFMHRIGYGTGGIAYDLLENFRAVECDHAALMLVHKKKITPSDFVRTGEKCFFNERGRKKILEFAHDLLAKTRSAHEKVILELTDSLQDVTKIPDFVLLQRER